MPNNETQVQRRLRLKLELDAIKKEVKADKVYITNISLHTISEKLWYYDDMPKSFKPYKKTPEDVIHQIIRANRNSFDFLNIESCYTRENNKPALKLITKDYAGVVPLCSPFSGDPIANIEIIGRFNENVGELMTLIGEDISVEYDRRLELCKKTYVSPPYYLECLNFIVKYLDCEKVAWQKFSTVVLNEREPSSSTNWVEYATRTAHAPQSYNLFKNNRNILSREHEDQWKINYVLQIAIDVLESRDTPQKILFQYHEQIDRLKLKVKSSKVLSTTYVDFNSRDNIYVKQLKEQANVLLGLSSNKGVAWRTDYMKFFEAYVQYLFKSVAQRKNARIYNNPHYGAYVNNKPYWSPHYIEPDIILQKNNELFVVDAKYKNHMLGWNTRSEKLKETFREDLFQVLAYSAFTPVACKNVMLVYPFADFVTHKMKIVNPINQSSANVYLVGVPLDKNNVEATIQALTKVISFGDC